MLVSLGLAFTTLIKVPVIGIEDTDTASSSV